MYAGRLSEALNDLLTFMKGDKPINLQLTQPHTSVNGARNASLKAIPCDRLSIMQLLYNVNVSAATVGMLQRFFKV